MNGNSLAPLGGWNEGEKKAVVGVGDQPILSDPCLLFISIYFYIYIYFFKWSTHSLQSLFIN